MQYPIKLALLAVVFHCACSSPTQQTTAKDITPPPPVTTIAPPAVPVDACAMGCEQQVKCARGQSADVEQCRANCRKMVEMSRADPQCAKATEAKIACFAPLRCEEWDKYFAAMKAQLLDYPCAVEEVDVNLHCRVSPAAASCMDVCASRLRCADPAVSSVEKCARECLRESSATFLQKGAKCWNANVVLNICRAPLTCGDQHRLQTGARLAGHPCASAIAEVNRECR